MNVLDPTVMVAETQIVVDSRAAIEKKARAEYALKIAKEKLDSAMGKDKVWRELTVRRSKLLLKTRVVKTRLMKDPKIIELSDAVDECREELKGNSQQLSLFLDKYVEQTHTNVITDNAGNKFVIVKDHRLKKGRKS